MWSNQDRELVHPIIEADDIEQEVALLHLQGKRASRKIVEKRLAAEMDSTPLYAGDEGTSPWRDSPVPSPQVIQRLTSWTLFQALDVQFIVWEFLESPDDHFDSTLRALRKRGVIPSAKARSKRRGNLGRTLVHALPASFDELVEVVQENHKTKRPQATVRQFLRRNIRGGAIHELQGVYYVAG